MGSTVTTEASVTATYAIIQIHVNPLSGGRGERVPMRVVVHGDFCCILYKKKLELWPTNVCSVNQTTVGGNHSPNMESLWPIALV